MVNALLQNAAQIAVALQDQDIGYAGFMAGQGSRQARRAPAYDNDVLLIHGPRPLAP